MNAESLGDQIKRDYEDRTRYYLPRKVYTIVRVDGKNFSSYTRMLKKPFDHDLVEDFNETAKEMCASMMGCEFAYTQSDEMTFVLSDFSQPNSEAWFGGNLQKIVSVSASLATAFFNARRATRGLADRPAFFDARAFSVSNYADMANCLLWRQMDASRNAVSMIARAHFSHSEMQGMSVSDMRRGLAEKSVDLAAVPPGILMGRIVRRETYSAPVVIPGKSPDGTEVLRSRWVVCDAPNFSESGTLPLKNEAV
jgi:tRNA(His) 5'-end guanylyltransferase